MAFVRSARPAFASLGILLVAASCDKSPTSSLPRPNILARLELQAPGEIPPGASVQLTADAVKPDGSVENVSSQAVWTPQTSDILQISPSGLATGKTRGEEFATARYAGLSASARILVLPPGTFRLSGIIKEEDVGVPGVAVTVISASEKA